MIFYDNFIIKAKCTKQFIKFWHKQENKKMAYVIPN